MIFEFIGRVLFYFAVLFFINIVIWLAVSVYRKEKDTYSINITNIQQLDIEDVLKNIPEIDKSALNQYGFDSFIMLTCEYSVTGGIQTPFKDTFTFSLSPDAPQIVVETNATEKMEKNSGIVTHIIYACESEQDYKIDVYDNRTDDVILNAEFTTLMESK